VVRSHLANVVALSVTALIVWGACPHATRAAQDAASAVQPRGLLPATVAWETRLEPLPAAPAAHDGTRVYVPRDDGALVALDRASGALAWTVPALGRSTPLVGAGRVYVLAGGALVALDGASGRQLWRVPVEGLPDVAPAPGAVTPAAVVLLTGRRLVAFRTEDGSVLWEFPLPDAAAMGTVTPGADAVFVTHATGVAAIGLAGGTLHWQRTLPGVAGTPALIGDRLLVGTADRDVVALRASSGDVAWRWHLGGVFVGAAARDDLVYVSALDALLRALRLDGGNQVWKVELQTRPVAPPVVRGPVVAQAGNDPVLTTFDARTGTAVARHVENGDLLGPPLFAPSEADVGIVLLFRDGRVVGLGAGEE
jgi:outer membrane protein assembly factor BamB